jgi:HAD superfamily hydrolase (TIGR01450 family)
MSAIDLSRYDAYLFDLDGTIYAGSRLLSGAKEAISLLRSRNKQIMMVTNTSVYTRHDCRQRLRHMGIELSLDQVITAAYMAGLYFRERYPDAVVYIIGEEALTKEIVGLDIRTTDDPYEATHLLVGMDRRFDYGKLYLGMKAVRNGASLVATNADPYCPVFQDIIPDTWGIAKAIESAAAGRIAAVTGKPEKFYVQKTLEHLNVPAHRCLMTGDRLETDIMLGINGGMGTALVLTGVTGIDDLTGCEIRPDYVFADLKEMFAV